MSNPRSAFVPWHELLAPGETRIQQRVHAEERAATVITGYNDNVITGLLQTRSYALAILTEVIRSHELPGDPEEAADARVARQDVLNDPSKTFRMVLHENALYFQVGGPATMLGQMDRLEHFALHGAGAAVHWGILPRTAPYQGSWPTRSFVMHDDVASEETIGGALTVSDPAAVAGYRRAYELVALSAVRGEAAAGLIRSAREHWAAR